MSVEQHHSRSGSAMSHPEDALAEIDLFQPEAFEHSVHLPQNMGTAFLIGDASRSSAPSKCDGERDLAEPPLGVLGLDFGRRL